MKYFTKFFLFMMVVFMVGAPSNIQAAKRNSDAFDHLITYPKSIYWKNNATLSSHRSAFQNAVNRSNQLSGIQFYHTSNENLALVRAHTMYGNGGNWGYWQRRSDHHYVAISGSSTTNFTTNQINWVGIHEIGHALGLNHQKASIASVMRTGGPYTYTNFTELDKENLNWGYR